MTRTQFLLCTDLDRTLLPNGAQPESPTARRRFQALAVHPEVTLVYVTGRDRQRVERAIVNYRLPRPQFVISDVGTNIYDLRQDGWQVWQRWLEEIAPDWDGFDHQRLSRLLSGFSDLRLQEVSKQNTFKLSYYVPLHVNRSALDQALSDCLQEHQVDASLIWSVDEPAGIGLLDVLPKRATKLHALEFLQSFLGVPLEQTLFAGDSGNDLPVLASEIPAVLVANAMPSVAQEAFAAAVAAGHRNALYLAKGGFLDMNGNYSAGILEGVAHYHPELLELFSDPNP
ncbi:MAG: HAD-IIB family hydrolase [Chromatiales bacterium]|jgi:HAD superfamily hydrolase (TIGR01484 family)